MQKHTVIGLGLLGGLLVIAAFVASMHPENAALPGNVPNIPASSTSSSGTPSGLPVMADFMPAFTGITHWWNTPDGQPLTPEKLRGKVVLVDFWTYSCINCIRTYPFLKAMQEKYADKGLVIVGVHTPEFAFEAVPANVGDAIAKNGLLYPVALDPDYGTWNAYHNQYWPAEYLFDAQGRLRHVHYGEGEYDQSEQAIRVLLGEMAHAGLGDMADIATPDLSKINTPETYFGLSRGNAFSGTTGPSGKDATYTAGSSVQPNRWSADGTWQFQDEYVESRSVGAVFRMSVQADQMHIVMSSADGLDKHIEIYVDGTKTGEQVVNASQLYNIASFPDAKRHVVEIRIREAGVRFFATTFS